MGMKPVVLKRFARGFIVNRIQRAINQELFQLLDDGVADAAALDDAVSVCLGAPCRDGVPVQTGFHRT